MVAENNVYKKKYGRYNTDYSKTTTEFGVYLNLRYSVNQGIALDDFDKKKYNRLKLKYG